MAAWPIAARDSAGTLAKYYDPTDEMLCYLAVGGSAVIFGMLIGHASPLIRRLMRGVQ